jgi:fructose-specific phosphotransferase system IIA component
MVITPDQVWTNQQFGDVDEVLRFLAHQSVEQGFADDEAAVYNGFQAREAEGTTGMMEGFAIPHCQVEAIIEPKVAVIKNQPGRDIAWETLDGKPIHTAIALFVPKKDVVAEHLKLLSSVALLLSNDEFTQFLNSTDDPQLIVAKMITVLNLRKQ